MDSKGTNRKFKPESDIHMEIQYIFLVSNITGHNKTQIISVKRRRKVLQSLNINGESITVQTSLVLLAHNTGWLTVIKQYACRACSMGACALVSG